MNLSSNCILVEGIKYWCLVDAQYDKVYRFKYSKKIDISDIDVDLQAFLEANDILTLFDNIDYIDPFSGSKMVYIDNAIIYFKKETVIFILNQLKELNCRHLEIRIKNLDDSFDILRMIDYLAEGSYETITIYSEVYFDYSKLLTHLNNLVVLIFFNFLTDSLEYSKNVKYIKTKLDDNCCGKINLDSFISNPRFVSLAKNMNSCLAFKISVDKDGNIKNCPSMTQNYGNIRDTTLKQAMSHPDFKKYWNIKKDDITKCKDCEFRYICTDCRAYIDDSEDIYSAPLKCGYDPYTGVWEDWSTNPLKQKAIEYYGMQDLVAQIKETNTPE